MQFAQRGVWDGWKPHKHWVFPHYMWGCIVYIQSIHTGRDVPSLYVRVYRFQEWGEYMRSSSLIICEGVSYFCRFRFSVSVFPHYMWGCLDELQAKFDKIQVPSLYVRVYRASMFHQPPILGSLIICEGVSEKVLSFLYDVFPHYMWGCIGF